MPTIDASETSALIRQRKSSAHAVFVTSYPDDTTPFTGTSSERSTTSSPRSPEVLAPRFTVFVELCKKTAQVKAQAARSNSRRRSCSRLAQASLAVDSALSPAGTLQVP